MDYPGMTELVEYKKPIASQGLLETKPTGKRPVILLASALITQEIIFNNGLFQNILVLYNMFESMGYDVYLLAERKGDGIDGYKTILPEEIIRNPLQLHTFIEIGMSVSATFRTYLRENGAKLVKLYLGNVVNIDIESVHMTPGLDFPHHVTGDMDEIWTSPHYGQNLDYITVINRLRPNQGKIAPYVWDRCFINNRIKEWIPPVSWQHMDIVITEPNISFQKVFVLPLLLVEAFAEKNPEWKGHVYVMNSSRIKGNVHVMKTVLPSLKIFPRISLEDRRNIVSLTTVYNNTLFIGHQFNNDFNYMTLELLLAGFPVLHNSSAWSKFGYYWTPDRWDESLNTLKEAMQFHTRRLTTYKTHAEQLAWAHSIHNPEIRERWAKLLEK
jgi:hypothetical protein